MASAAAATEQQETSYSQQSWENARRVRIARAREDMNVFMEFVMRDERTGKEIHQAPVHVRWHKLAGQYRRLVLWSHPSAGKTAQLTTGRLLWMLGQDPTRRLAIVGNTAGQAEKVLGSVRQYITKSPILRQVFPDLKPDPAKPWTQKWAFVERPTVAKDPSVQALGVAGPIQGSRLDGMILDDVVDFENSRTKGQRDMIAEWFFTTAIERVDPGGFIIVIGNAFHPDDLLHRLARLDVWHSERFPIVDAQGQSTWPARFTQERIEEIRESMPPLAFAQQYMCDARDDATSAFKRSWFDACVARGQTDRYEDWWRLQKDNPFASMGCRIITGVDLAVKKKDSADLTAMFTMMLYPNGDRRLLNIEAAHLSFPETVDLIKQVHARYGGLVIVENNAAQDFLVQHMVSTTAIPILGYTTTDRKAHPEFGIAGLSVEFRNAKWIIPSNGGLHPQVRSWLDEMLYYDPAAHTGDRLMASWLAVQGIGMTSGREVTVRNLNTR